MSIESRDFYPPLSLRESLGDYIKQHVAGHKLQKDGREGALGQLSHCRAGCIDGRIERCNLTITDFKINPGDRKVLIGPNGAGKTTVFTAIMESDPTASFSTSGGRGAVLLGGGGFSHGRDRMRVARLNQEELLDSQGNFEVGVLLNAAEERFKGDYPVDFESIKWDEDLDKANKLAEQMKGNERAQNRIASHRKKLVELFKADEFINRRVSDLSGGERTKLSLIMTLMSDPDLLLLDEPTNHLDLGSIGTLSGILDLYRRAGISVLSASHVPSYLEFASTDGTVMINVDEQGKRTLTSSSASYEGIAKDKSRERFSVVERGIDWASNQSGVKRKQGPLLTSRESFTIKDSPLINITLDNISSNSFVVLVGDNGSGKTRLMEVMMKQKEGAFIREQGANLVYLPQFWPDEVAHGTLENFFSWVAQGANKHSAIGSNQFSKALDKIGFKRKEGSRVDLRRKLSSYSGGEQRLLWFVAVSCFPEVDGLILDEPTNHMDQQLQDVVTKAIQSFKGAVVVSTHDLKLLDAVYEDAGPDRFHRTVLLEKKKGVSTVSQIEGNPADVMRKKFDAAAGGARKKLSTTIGNSNRKK